MHSLNKALVVVCVGAAVAVLAPATALGAVSAGPMAMAVLEARITDVMCTIVTADGTTAVPCDNSAWSPELRPSWRAEMTVTIDYHYADDGLSLGWVEGTAPRPIGFTLSEGGGVIIPEFESGAIYTRAPTCPVFSCGPAGDYGGDVGAYPPVFLSNNSFAEDLNGTVTVTSAATASPGFYGWTPTLYVEIWQLQVNSVTAAVPEPGTWALMIGPLLCLGFLAHRRTVPASP
jgi:hypothetical protein